MLKDGEDGGWVFFGKMDFSSGLQSVPNQGKSKKIIAGKRKHRYESGSKLCYTLFGIYDNNYSSGCFAGYPEISEVY